MPVRDNLGSRMKTFYEQIPKTKLMRRVPVAIRIDGKSFHTFTKGFQKPFDSVLMESMQQTMTALCENIQGCYFGYTQSDEITLLLSDYRKLNSDAWFDYEVQKMCSVAASMATMYFNKYFTQNVHFWGFNHFGASWGTEINKFSFKESEDENERLASIYTNAVNKGAMFDARVFNIPKEEVVNLVYWRQLDATRNSIQMVGQANYSHKELQYKTCNMIQNMLLTEKNINWNNFPTDCKRGAACLKVNGEWKLDLSMPILKGEDRKYLEDLVYYEED